MRRRRMLQTLLQRLRRWPRCRSTATSAARAAALAPSRRRHRATPQPARALPCQLSNPLRRQAPGHRLAWRRQQHSCRLLNDSCNKQASAALRLACSRAASMLRSRSSRSGQQRRRMTTLRQPCSRSQSLTQRRPHVSRQQSSKAASGLQSRLPRRLLQRLRPMRARRQKRPLQPLQPRSWMASRYQQAAATWVRRWKPQRAAQLAPPHHFFAPQHLPPASRRQQEPRRP